MLDMDTESNCTRQDGLRVTGLPSQDDDLSGADDAVVISDADHLVSNGAVEFEDRAIISLCEVKKFGLIVKGVRLLISEPLALFSNWQSSGTGWCRRAISV